DQRYPQLQQSRTRQRGCNDVVRDGRNAHAQNQAGQHGQHQGKEQVVLTDGDDPADEGGGDARQGQRADDDADNGAGDADGQGVLCALGQRVHANPQGFATALEQQAGDDQGKDDEAQYVNAIPQKGRRSQAE